MKSTKKGSALFLLSVLTLGSFGLTAEASAQLAKPSKPQGTSDEWKTDAPEEEQALSAVDHGGNAADDQLKNIAETNPFIHILDGFDQVWSMNQPEWRDGTALTEPGENGEVASYGDGQQFFLMGTKMMRQRLLQIRKPLRTLKLEMQLRGKRIFDMSSKSRMIARRKRRWRRITMINEIRSTA